MKHIKYDIIHVFVSGKCIKIFNKIYLSEFHIRGADIPFEACSMLICATLHVHFDFFLGHTRAIAFQIYRELVFQTGQKNKVTVTPQTSNYTVVQTMSLHDYSNNTILK
jgi:hypothetical protein